MSLFAAGTVIFMGIITGEIVYPVTYTTFANDISDLGATRPPDSVSYEPSATIFNTGMILGGLLLLLAGLLFVRRRQGTVFTSVFVLFAASVLGVGLFPGNMAPYHGYFSMGVFVFGAVCALLTFRITNGPFRIVGGVLGAVSLGVLAAAVFAPAQIVPYLGSGGTERWVAYPVLLWLLGTGGLLLGSGAQSPAS